MGSDEIGLEPAAARPAVDGRRRLLVTLLVLMAAGYAFANRTHPVPTQAAPPTTSAGPQPLTRVTPPPHLVVGEVCSLTAAGDTVTITFTLLSASPQPLAFISVEPVLPLEGLAPLRTTLAGGSCALPTRTPPGVLHSQGTPVLVTFLLGTVGQCPAAQPVAAKVFVRDAEIVAVGVRVLPDLGALHVGRCDIGSG